MSATQRRDKPVYIDESSFTLKSYNAGSEGIVATTKVPNTSVWRVPVGMPLVVNLVAKQSVTVTSGSTETKSLDPEAPIVDYLPDPTAGEYEPDAYLAAYYDSDGDGDGDTLVSDSTATQFTGNFTTSGDFVTDVELKETDGGGDVTVDIYTIVRHGYAKLQKRNSGKQNITQELQTEDAISWAFSNPDAPDADRQITWDSKNRGLRGVIPPKFHLDMVYYNDTYTTAVEDAAASNLELSIPLIQRPVRPDESPAELRSKVSLNMAGAN